MKDKNVDEMDESELKRELKELYRKVNDLTQKEKEDLDFNIKMKMTKRNEDDEVVQEIEEEL